MFTLSILNNEIIDTLVNKYNLWRKNRLFVNNHTDIPELLIGDNGIPCFYYQDIESINNCTSSTIAVNCLTEGIHCKPIFDLYDPNKQYIIFSNGWWDQSKVKLNFNYDLVWYYFFLFEYIDEYFSPSRFSFYFDRQYQFEDSKPMLFVSTIGTARPERTYLVDQLLKQVNNKRYFLKYAGIDQTLSTSHLDIIPTNNEFDPYKILNNEYYYTISNSIPIDLYNQCYFNLVVETDIDWDHEFMMTEKTVKALISGIPFIILSTPNFLTNLQKLGFKTYNEIWDESYDTVLDYQQRIQQIIKLINSLDKFDWQHHRNKLQTIAEYNYRHFASLEKISEQCFLNFKDVIIKHERRH